MMNMKNNLNPSSWTFKISLLSLSILAQTAPSVSIANTQLAHLFPEQSTSAIELISTLPNFGVLLLILFYFLNFTMLYWFCQISK